MRDALKAGIALFNDEFYHAAHDAWESDWLTLESGSPDERFLHGLIQYTAAVYHLEHANDIGAIGLAESASAYLADLPSSYHGVDLTPIRDTLDGIAEDGKRIDPQDIAWIPYNGTMLTLPDLEPPARWIAAEIIAEEVDGFDQEVLSDAIAWAESGGPESLYAKLVTDFVEDATRRGVIYTRLSQHVARERSRQRDVSGLFEDGQPD